MAKPSAGFTPWTRRQLLRGVGMGMAAIGCEPLLSAAGSAATGLSSAVNPLAPKAPPFPAKAKRVVHIFLNGGLSQVDSFDPKPSLAKYGGKSLPVHLRTERSTGAAFPSPFKFQRYGESGIEVSEIFKNVGSCADDLCVIRSMHTNVPNHIPSLMMMNCGAQIQVRPSLGSWVTYGLGSENRNLPGFVALCPNGAPIADALNWRSAFLPGAYQGTYIDPSQTEVERLIANIKNHYVEPAAQRRQLDVLARLNRGSSERARRGHVARSAHPVFRAGLPHADGSVGGLRHQRRTGTREAGLRRHGARPPDAHRAPLVGKGRAVRADLARAGATLGQPQRDRKKTTAGSLESAINRSARFSRTSNSGACSMTRWFICGGEFWGAPLWWS